MSTSVAVTPQVLVKLFGPARVVHSESGEERDLGAIPRRVLTQLVLAGGLGSTTDTVVTNTWEAPPASATQSLRNHVAALRRHLGPAGREHLIHQTSGYVLSLDRSEIDVLRFEDEIATALDQLRDASLSNEDTNAAARQLEAALNMWVGPPFVGVEDHPLVEGLPVFLAGRHLEASLTLAEIQLRADDSAAAEETLHAAARVDQWDQRVLRSHMNLLEQDGRRPAAIRMFEDFSAQLRQELGADPESASRAVYERLLNYSPDNPPRRTTPIGSPAAPPMPSQRPTEIASVQGFLDSPERILVIVGGFGMGRSTLLEFVEGTVAHRVGRLLQVHLAPANQQRSSGDPIVEGLLADGDRYNDELDQAARDLGPDARPVDVLARWLALQQDDVLVVIDDLHHAPETSVHDLLAALQSRPWSGARLAVSRDLAWTGPAAQAWMDFESEMQRLSEIRVVTLAPLAASDIDELAQRETGAPLHPHVLAAVTRDSGGLPRLARALVRDHYQDGAPVPESINRQVEAQLRGLVPELRGYLERCAVMSPRADLSGLRDAVQMRAAIKELTTLNLLREDQSSARTEVTFVAPIVGRSIYETMMPGRRHELHMELAHELEANPARIRDAAHHALAAEEAMLPQDVLRIVSHAATSAGGRAEVAEATTLYLAALRLHRLVHPGDQAGFMRLFVDLFRCVDDVAGPEVSAAWSLALAGARQHQDAALLMRLIESRLDRPIGANDEFIALLDEAIEWPEAHDPAVRVGLQARMAVEISESHAWPLGHDLAGQAETVARQAGDPALLGMALRAVLSNSFRTMDGVQRLDASVEFTNLARMVANPDFEMIGLSYQYLERIAGGERAGVMGLLDDVEQLARDRNRPRYIALVLSTRASIALAQGNVDEAAAHVEGVKEQSERSPNRDVAYAALAFPIIQAWTVGELHTMAPFLAAAWEPETGELFHRFLLAASLAAMGERENLDHAVELVGEVDLANLPSGMFLPGYLATATDTVVASQDLARAQILLPQLEAMAGRHLIYGGGLGLLGPADGFTAELLHLLGHVGDSQRHFDRAVALASDSGDTFIVDRLRRRQRALGRG